MQHRHSTNPDAQQTFGLKLAGRKTNIIWFID